MAYHHELLQQANELAHKSDPNQADLRRAVSSAYYALFHLLVSETIRHWSLDSSRNALSRMFDHALMKRASNRLSDPRLFPFTGENPAVVGDAKTVASTFVELQNKRHIADYDNATFWDPTLARPIVLLASQAFDLWKRIGHEKIARITWYRF